MSDGRRSATVFVLSTNNAFRDQAKPVAIEPDGAFEISDAEVRTEIRAYLTFFISKEVNIARRYGWEVDTRPAP